jgi:hypothetical protein
LMDTDLDHSQVDFGGKPAVQFDLLPAVKIPLLQGGKVKETEVHGFLDLVSMPSRQKDGRYMSLNQLYFWGMVRVYPRILKSRQEKRKFHNAILIFFSLLSRGKALSRAPLPLLEWRKSLD